VQFVHLRLGGITPGWKRVASAKNEKGRAGQFHMAPNRPVENEKGRAGQSRMAPNCPAENEKGRAGQSRMAPNRPAENEKGRAGQSRTALRMVSGRKRRSRSLYRLGDAQR